MLVYDGFQYRQKVLFLKIFLSFAPVLFFSSCAYQDNQQKGLVKPCTPLFIAMPKNREIFDNIGPSLYEALYKRFSLNGYKLVGSPGKGYQLIVSIERWEPVHKLVSPDVVLFHEERILEISYQVRDFTDKVVLEKKRICTLLLSKPENPILNTDFVHFELERLLVRIARDIELYIRPFFIK